MARRWRSSNCRQSFATIALVVVALAARIHTCHGGPFGFLGKGKSKGKKCDLSVGSWVPSTAYPAYNSSCPFISQEFNCEKNGRPDGDFRHFAWQPTGCNLNKLDAKKFAKNFLAQSVAFVGDNTAMYMMQSLRCRMFAAGIRTKDWDPSTVGWTGTGFKIVPYGVTVVFVHAPFLMEAEPITPGARSLKNGWIVHTDQINHKLTEMLPKLRSVVLVTGSYYSDSANRTFYRQGAPYNVQPPPINAYGIVLKTIADYIKSKPMIVQPYALSIPPAHQPNMFEYADTSCAFFAGPLTQTAANVASARSVVTAWTNKLKASVANTRISALDILPMSIYRADAHVGMYGEPGGSDLDCKDWCLPGVPDFWLDMWYTEAAFPFGFMG